MNCENLAEVPVVWRPGENYGIAIKKFTKIVEEKYNIKIGDFWDLHKWSVDNICEFWSELWDFIGIVSSKRFSKVVDLNVPINELPEWFIDAKLNIAENLLKYRDDRIALIVAGEGKETERITYAEMYEEARLYAAAFRKMGLKKNDVVVCQMSNRKEPIFAMEAVTSIGALWAGALPLLGVQAVLNRFKQVNPKVFFTLDCFPHDGVEYDTLEKVKEIVEGLPTLEKVIIVPTKENSHLKDISGIRNSCFLDEFLQMGRNEDGSVPPMVFEQLSFSHPVYISFTSGTSGLPKSIIHGCCGLLATGRDFAIHFDLDDTSVWLSMSPVGWASWNMFTYILHFGRTLLLFEGVPYFLTPTYFWDMVDEFKISHLLLTSSVLDEFQKRGYVPTEKHSLKSLRVLASGGSVVKPQTYDFVYEKLKKNIPFSAAYGCTELMGFVISVETTVPIHRGELAAFGLGVLFETVDETGKPVYGEVGELVITKPMPNLLLGIWGDEDGSVVKEKYFSKFPGKFAVGDYGIINPHTKGIVICCRSDETLKQRGCRFGSSEIYNVVDLFPEVRDSLCVSQYNKQMDERAVLFLKIRDGHKFSDKLVSDIRSAITRELTVRHVPDVIIETQDIPYNINGKKLEIIVKRVINRMAYSADTIQNPESLQYYMNVPELQDFL